MAQAKATSIDNIATGDNVNLGNVVYQVASITSAVNNGYGKFTVIVVLNNSNNTSVTLTTANTVLSGYKLLLNGNQVGSWVTSQTF